MEPAKLKIRKSVMVALFVELKGFVLFFWFIVLQVKYEVEEELKKAQTCCAEILRILEQRTDDV